MYTNRIKTRIAVTIFILLLFGMLLLDAIGFVLHYQYVVHTKVDEVKRQLIRLASDIVVQEPELKYELMQKAPKTVRKALGDTCLSVELTVNGVELRDGSADKNPLKTIVENTARTGKETVMQLEGLHLPFFVIPNKFAIVVPAKQSPASEGAIQAIGVIITTRNVLYDLWEKQKIIFVYILINAIILTTVAFFRLRKILFDPVSKLVDVAENYQLAEGKGLFPEYEANEFGQLARAMNSMLERIEEDRDKLYETVKSLASTNEKLKIAQDEVILAEKLASTGRLFAGLAHEVGNPVAIVQGYLELLEHDDIDAEDRKQFARRGLQELHRIDNLLNQLHDATRSDDGQIHKVDLNATVRNLNEILEVSFAKKQICIIADYSDEPVYVKGNREKIHQVLLNMVLNAMDAVSEKMISPFKAEINITVKTELRGDIECAVITIRDNGRGIPPENQDVIFEPFFTTKEPGKGTGLGLAVSYRIIQSHGGRIEVESEMDKGTVFTLILPKYS